MVGVEFVTDRKEKMAAKAETAVLFEKMRGSIAKCCSFLFFFPFFSPLSLCKST